MTLLKTIARQNGTAVIVVTHDERMIDGFDTIKRMRDGRFVEGHHGDPAIPSARSICSASGAAVARSQT